MIKLFKVKEQQKEIAENAKGKLPVKKQSAGELRLQKDVSELNLPKTCNLSFPNGKDDLMNFEVTIQPDEGFYKGGMFTFTIQVPPVYPYEAPKVKCSTKVYHPNIDLEGNVCLNILREDWKPVLNINTIIYALYHLFTQPNYEDPLNQEAAHVLRDNPDLRSTKQRASMAGDAILGYIGQHGDLPDSRKFAKERGFEHDEVVDVIKSLNRFQYVVAMEYEEKNWVLTEEGKGYAAEGSPEFRIFSAIPAEGILPKELEEKVGLWPAVFKNGHANAMKNNWLEMRKQLVARKVENVDDRVKDLLIKIQLKESVDQVDIDELKKRRLISEQKLKGYSVVKGVNFALKRRKAATGLTRENLQREDWRDLEFKEYNIAAKGQPSEGGYLHPVLKVRDRLKTIFRMMGFEEMPTNNYVESSFWNFDALFQPQQHPARDSHDTFYLQTPSTTRMLPEDYVERVKQVHEVGGFGSRGYAYDWKREEANKNLLRTHTTAVSSRMLYQLAQKPFAPKKYFSIDRVFRNEAVDRTHLAEFHQIEGLICDRGLTLGDLIGVLQDFFSRLGMSKLRFKPAYNPYTEPSMEIFSYHEGFKKWVEIGNSGMFRPEMLLPMGLPEDVRVIAWGLSLERPTMILYGIDNIRDLFGHKTDLTLIKKNPICRIGL